MDDAGDFVERFAEYAEIEHSDTLYCYSSYTGAAGALLLKIRQSTARILFRLEKKDSASYQPG